MTSPTFVPFSWEAVQVTAVERHVWLRVALVVGAFVVAQPAQAGLWVVPAITFVVLVRTLVGSVVGGLLFGWLLLWAADIPNDMGAESFVYVAPLVPFVGAMVVAVFAGVEWMVAHERRSRR
jgi:hypothetical protein